jgi:hypothetical protein
MSVKNLPQTNEGKGELITPTPSKIDLRNCHAIRRELASVYRDMRCGNIEPADGTKLAYVLDQLRKAYETAVLEQRLEDIEKTLNKRN